MTPVHALDSAAAGLVRAYADTDLAAVVVRVEAGRFRIICPDGMPAAIARLLYAAADEMAARAMPQSETRH